jgi:coenzyme PQQ precursor peptide PqqA
MKPWKKPAFEEVVLALEVKGYANAEQPLTPPAGEAQREVSPEKSPQPLHAKPAEAKSVR